MKPFLNETILSKSPELARTVAQRVYTAVREIVQHVEADRRMDTDIHQLVEFVRSGELRRVVSAV